MLKIHNISKKILNKVILNDISFEIDVGKVVFLLGESGTGKSTLLRLLNYLETPDTGSIFLSNKEISKKNAHTYISLVFQHFNLFPHLSVKDNLILVLEKVSKKTKKEAGEKATELLIKYKLADKIDAPISSLSGGQKQRLAIARALTNDPQVICMDEPTSALDPALTNHIAQQIQSLADEGKIVIVATHSLNLVLNEQVDGTIYLMKQGQIVEQATTDEVKLNSNTLTHVAHFLKGEAQAE